MNYWTRFRSFISNVRSAFAVRALDDSNDRVVGGVARDRRQSDREEVLRDALEAWRVNPLARRIVSLTSQYVVGGGVTVNVKHTATQKFLNEWWGHSLNRMVVRVMEWCDELTRSGELFIVVSTDGAGMSYVRAIPAQHIQAIESADNDIEQAKVFIEFPKAGEVDGRRWAAYDSLSDDGVSVVMLHFAINRPVGTQRGESDLAPLLKWLSRYSNWLEDRARLNKFRQAFVYVVKTLLVGKERKKREREINANPPSAGSVLVTGEDETWEVLSPKLESHDAGEDGLALKKMIAGGAGVPLHFLAEPESSTRTTAESAGGPTYRHYQQRQVYFVWMLGEIVKVVLVRRARKDKRVKVVEVEVTAPDISARDNAALALAVGQVVAAFGDLYDRGLIEAREFLRMCYQFAGELVDLDELEKLISAPRSVTAPGGGNGKADQSGVKVDSATGDVTGVPR